ncbi:MAG TPA: glycoside hydrolase family 31 protein [Ignavibacteria bacterium]|jgi:alpha-glucosidase
MKEKQEGIKLAKVYNEYFRVKYENSKWKILGRVIEYEQKNNQVILHCKNGKIIITILTEKIINVKTQLDGKNSLPSFAISNNIEKNVNINLIENDFLVKIKTEEIIIEVVKDPCRIIFKNKEGEVINSDGKSGISYNSEFVRCDKILDQEEYFYGFGDKTGPLQKKGMKMYMWNTDFPYLDVDSDPLYKSVPFFIGLKNGNSYGIFLDCPSWSFFDMGNTNIENYSFGCFSLNLDYYFIYGPDIKDVVNQYTYITGRIELPPLWSLGYQQCRWSYDSEEKVKEIANSFRSKKIPCDVLYLDIDYMDSFKVFTVDKKKFPDLNKLCQYLSQKGFKLVCIVDPGVKVEDGYEIYDEGIKTDYFVKRASGKTFTAEVWPGKSVWPDFLNSDVRKWWASLQSKLLDLGVAGIWNDMNEPATFNTPGKTFSLDVQHNYDGVRIDHALVHNLYGLLENYSTYKGFLQNNPNVRPFILSRSIYAGGQKYAAVWTGDNTSNEDHLKLSIPQCLNLGLSGFSFAGMDIGGFHGNPSPELYTRWLQMGVFFPLCRTHSVIDSNDQEPWSYGGGYEEINRKAIELRYKLLPYIYSVFYESYLTGLPVIRPLVLEYPSDKNTYELQDEFLLGDKLLVAPFLELGTDSRTVYLPDGLWYDYFTFDEYQGKEYYEIEADINKVPLFVKAGSIIPESKILQYVNEQPNDKIILNVYPGNNIDSLLYEDDGISFDYKLGKYRLTYLSQSFDNDKIYINISEPEGNYEVIRTIQLNIFSIRKMVKQVIKDLDTITLVDDESVFAGSLDVAFYDKETKVLKIKFSDKNINTMIVIEL